MIDLIFLILFTVPFIWAFCLVGDKVYRFFQYIKKRRFDYRMRKIKDDENIENLDSFLFNIDSALESTPGIREVKGGIGAVGGALGTGVLTVAKAL